MGTKLTEAQIRAIGKKIVAKSKRESRKDTRALMRSISFSYVKKVIIFRELYYGKFSTPSKGKNSQLEKNAIAMVPNGVQWKIIRTNFSGGGLEIGRTRNGRATQKSILPSLNIGSSNNIKSLIARSRAKKIAAAKKAKDLENGKA